MFGPVALVGVNRIGGRRCHRRIGRRGGNEVVGDGDTDDAVLVVPVFEVPLMSSVSTPTHAWNGFVRAVP